MGEAEQKRLRVLFCHGEYGTEIALGFIRLRGAAGQLWIFAVGAFDVHGEQVHKILGKQIAHHIGAHAVGIKLYRHIQGVQVGDDVGQSFHHGGFAAGDDHTVYPALAGVQVPFDFGARVYGHVMRVPCKGIVVAGGAAHVAPPKKYDAGIHAGPVAQTYPFKSENIVPSRVCHA